MATGSRNRNGAGGDHGPVGQARADLGRDERRRGLRAAVGHDQREGIFVPRGDEAEHRRGGDAGGASGSTILKKACMRV